MATPCRYSEISRREPSAAEVARTRGTAERSERRRARAQCADSAAGERASERCYAGLCGFCRFLPRLSSRRAPYSRGAWKRCFVSDAPSAITPRAYLSSPLRSVYFSLSLSLSFSIEDASLSLSRTLAPICHPFSRFLSLSLPAARSRSACSSLFPSRHAR